MRGGGGQQKSEVQARIEENGRGSPTPVQVAMTGRQVVLRVATELLRTAVVAHQRRGDSDAVAHCFNQLLALDLTDAAWDPVLASAAGHL